MSHQRFIQSHASFPTRNASQSSQSHRAEFQRQYLPITRAREMYRPSTPPNYGLELGCVARDSPKTPPRARSVSSTNRSPSLDGVRRLYRKYPDQFPQTPPQAGAMLRIAPGAPGPIVPPKYWNSLSNPSPGSPSPDRPLSYPRTMTLSRMDLGCKKQAPEVVDVSEPMLMYPDFGSGFVPAENPAPNLALEIKSNPHDTEKWELPQRDIYEGWNGHGWKLELVISYTPSACVSDPMDFDFEPTIVVKNVIIECSLAAKPRLVPGTAIHARRPSESFGVSYRGFSTSYNSRGQLEPMQANHGIYMDRDWQGPTLATVCRRGEFGQRMEYRANIYVPIPSLLFSAADTRAFDIDARAWVSVANRSAVQLERSERITLSQFGQVSVHDDIMKCALMR